MPVGFSGGNSWKALNCDCGAMGRVRSARVARRGGLSGGRLVFWAVLDAGVLAVT